MARHEISEDRCGELERLEPLLRKYLPTIKPSDAFVSSFLDRLASEAERAEPPDELAELRAARLRAGRSPR